MWRTRSLGINLQGDKCFGKIWAPHANTVAIELFDCAEMISLREAGTGYWVLDFDEKIAPNTKYWLVLDGMRRLPDPASLSQPEGVHGPSQLLDLGFDWKDNDWINPRLESYIIYEIHTGTFSDQGNFEGIVARLEHLIDLGVTAIELMPVASFPGTRNWGYDGVFPFSVHESYGGSDKLQELVNICHAKGLAVVLDVVYNHLGPEGNYFNEFGPYFTDKYKTPWGSAVNCDDAYCNGMRDFITENVIMWFRDFHIDALRLDAVHAIKDYSAVHILQELRMATDALMEQTGRTHYLIAECDLNDPRYISSLNNNGLGMDAQWIDEFHHALRVTAGEQRLGYYSDFKGIEDLEKSYNDAYVYTGAYSSERKKNFGKKPVGHPGKQFVAFSQNHDHVGNRMLGERSSQLFSFEMLKLLAGAVICGPYLPLLFMGEEWAETNPFLYFTSHTNEELVELVRKGRQAEFSEMHQGGQAPDPQSEKSFLRSKLNWRLLDTERHQTIFGFYKHMIRLRKIIPSLGSDERSTIKTICYPEKNCLIVQRGMEGDDEVSLIIMNFSKQNQVLPLPDLLYRLKIVADSAAEEWGGPQSAKQTISPDVPVEAQPESILIYTANHA